MPWVLVMVIAIAVPEIAGMVSLIVMIYPRGSNPDQVIIALRVKADIAVPPIGIAAQPLPSLATSAHPAVPFSSVGYPNNQSVKDGNNDQAPCER